MPAVGDQAEHAPQRSQPEKAAPPEATAPAEATVTRLLALQRLAGNAAVARLVQGGGGGWLPAVAARRAQSGTVVQRQGDDERKAAVERAVKALGGVGGEVGRIEFGMRTPRGKPPESEGLVPTAKVTEKSEWFDNLGAAAGYASVLGSPAVVLEHEKLFTALPCQPTSKPFVRGEVYMFIPSHGAVRRAVGSDGLVYPPNKGMEVNPERHGLANDEAAALPPDAATMRALLGVPIERTGAEGATPGQAQQGPAGTLPGEVTIPEEAKQEVVTNFLVSSGLEVLDRNLAEARKLLGDFKPQGDGKGGDTVSAGAKKVIDSTKKLGPKFEELVYEEKRLANAAEGVSRKRSFSWYDRTLSAGGKTMRLSEWEQYFLRELKDRGEDKVKVLSQAPMLAHLVPQETAGAGHGFFSDVGFILFGEDEKKAEPGKGTSSYGQSVVAKGSDEEIRAQFLKKLDDVIEAILKAKGRVAGRDMSLLLKLGNLKARVEAQLKAIKGKNSDLDAVLAAMAWRIDEKETYTSTAGTVLEIGALFIPGVGPLLSAAIGFATAAHDFSGALNVQSVSQAALNPADALADQQEAASATLWSAVALALSAADLGNELLGLKIEKKMKDVPEGETPKKAPTDTPKGFVPSGKPIGAWDATTKLDPAFVGKLESLGIPGGNPNLANPGVVLQWAGGWANAKKMLQGGAGAELAAGDHVLKLLGGYREAEVSGLLEAVRREIETEFPETAGKHTYELTGTVSHSSDMDFSVSGPHKDEFVRRYNDRFRQKFGRESKTQFDNSVFTTPSGLEAPIDPTHLPPSKQAAEEAAKKGEKAVTTADAYKALSEADKKKAWTEFETQALAQAKDKGFTRSALDEAARSFPAGDLTERLNHVNNLQQEVASHMAMCENLMKQPDGAAAWAGHRKEILAATPADRRAMVERVLNETERRVNAFHDEVRNRTRALLEEATGKPPTDEEIAEFLAGKRKIQGKRADGTVGPLDPEDLHERARTDIYGDRIKGVADLKKKLEDPNLGAAERLQIAAQINMQESQALYFAPEAYQTHASILDVVQNAQKAEGKMTADAYGDLVSTKVSHVFFEQYGMAMAHTAADLNELVKLNKYAKRAGEVAAAHPDLVLPPMPSSLVAIMADKKNLPRIEGILKSNMRSGGDLQRAIQLQSAEVQLYLRAVSQQVASVHGPSIRNKWAKLPQDTARADAIRALLKLSKFGAEGAAE